MSSPLINKYYSDLDRVIQFGKSRNEDSIKSYFWILLNDYARKNHYEVVREVYCMGTRGSNVKPDGILKNSFGLEVGYWESKDEKDNIEVEIENKIKKGYPLTNTLFEDSKTAILYQRNFEVARVDVHDADKLHGLINEFIEFKSETIHKFEVALEQFKADIPAIVKTLREKIDEAGAKNKNFIAVSQSFLDLCKAEINPEITEADVREMMIQHILTSDIFNKIFNDPEFHRHNNIAHELEKLIETLFNHSARRNLMGNIEHYYDAINAAASSVVDHHEKQKFLKVLYENFYKVYNPKAADRLGVVYTPNEIVNFMIESTDHLLHKHFGKTLADKNVEILDPATGTGTFITSIIDYIPKKDLAYKYKNEIHANEVAILPYYVANLNMEFTFKQKMGYYEEFKNLCFVDTLDNTDALAYGGKQHALFGLSSENSERIKKQNSKKISVVIGNPPYNANQANENDNNKNREYSDIDKRIKDTYIKNSTAHKTKVYDMYARFYRWATDRLEKNGVLAFITNRSFIDSRTFDGFRKCVQEDFSACYIVDTKSDVRSNPKIAGTTHNVFGIQTGVAMMFLVKKEKQEGKCKIEYATMEDEWRKEIKLDWLRNNKIENIAFEKISPDKNNNWINLSENNWEALLPVTLPKLSGKKDSIDTFAVFELASFGNVSARDEWVYDPELKMLEQKLKFYIKEYNSKRIEVKRPLEKDWEQKLGGIIKWSQDTRHYFEKNIELLFEKQDIVTSTYRPFNKRRFYYSKWLNWSLYRLPQIFVKDQTCINKVICFSGVASNKPFQCLSINTVYSYDLLEKTQCLPLYRYDKEGNRSDNITNWGLEQFATHYKDKKIKKEDIFNYTYAVLHNPAYRKKYELNLKREFPRLPFYKDFWQWAKWGKQLMELHINYETVKPFNLKLAESKEFAKEKKKGKQETLSLAAEAKELYLTPHSKLKVKLKADKETGIIDLDETSSLHGIPKESWEYKLGNRSALEWILDQYKEKKHSDPTIAEKFNTYRFADYKDKVIDLLKRVTTVSVETMEIIHEMEKVKA
jgi:predicted helicase